jgi:predicted  nucleic acid-binding Zn-ribbon protein
MEQQQQQLKIVEIETRLSQLEGRTTELEKGQTLHEEKIEDLESTSLLIKDSQQQLQLKISEIEKTLRKTCTKRFQEYMVFTIILLMLVYIIYNIIKG